MSKSILIRDVPKEVLTWIDANRREYLMSQQEFVLNTMQKVSKSGVVFPPYFKLPKRNNSGAERFLFTDLFAGIGGFRIALNQLGGKCVFSSEINPYAQKTYKRWFGEMPNGDLRKIKPEGIPDHDILTAGFPCQPFSLAGVSKKNSLGMPHGFLDMNNGNLFFVLVKIIDAKRPKGLLLENVKNLKSHDKGKTWKKIRDTLEELDYWVFDEVIDASPWVPQHRERIYIVCFDRQRFPERPNFVFPNGSRARKPVVRDILEKTVSSKYTLTDNVWSYLQQHAQKHRTKGNGFGYGFADLDGVTRTLSARYYKDGAEILIQQKGKNPRRLSTKECSRLMGFPDYLPIAVSAAQAYKQFGNAAVPAVVKAIGRRLVKILDL